MNSLVNSKRLCQAILVPARLLSIVILIRAWWTWSAYEAQKTQEQASSQPWRSRFEVVIKIPDYRASTCQRLLQNEIDRHPAWFKSITFDNGSEFADMTKSKGRQIYFAHPYSPWERGPMRTAMVFCVNSSLRARAWKTSQKLMFNRQLMPLTTNIAESPNITQQRNSSSNIFLHSLTVALNLSIQEKLIARY